MPVRRDILAARYGAAVGVDETGLPQSEPVCPHSPDAGGADGGRIIEFLDGDWEVERRISDRRSGQDGVFSGTARFRPAGDSARCSSTPKTVNCGSAATAARPGRSLIYRGREDGGADVRFADGREFYRLDLRSGTCEADHPCRADHYHVTVTRLSADCFTETWQVAGPDKDYELETTYRRVGTGVLGTGPEGCDTTATRQPDGPR